MFLLILKHTFVGDFLSGTFKGQEVFLTFKYYYVILLSTFDKLTSILLSTFKWVDSTDWAWKRVYLVAQVDTIDKIKCSIIEYSKNLKTR